jgi:hypothetical protein
MAFIVAFKIANHHLRVGLSISKLLQARNAPLRLTHWYIFDVEAINEAY